MNKNEDTLGPQYYPGSKSEAGCNNREERGSDKAGRGKYLNHPGDALLWR